MSDMKVINMELEEFKKHFTKGKIMTREEIDRWLETNDFIYDSALLLTYPKSVFFVPTERGLGNSILGSGWVPGTIAIPHRVCPRKGLEDGWVKTFNDYLMVYGENTVFIESVEDLYNFIFGDKK